MSTAIGVTGKDMLFPALDSYTPSAVVLRSPAEQPLEEALVEVSAVLEAVGHLVVVVPAGLPAEHRMRLHSLRSLLESDRIALMEVDLPPLAVAALAQQLRQISPYDLGPGVIASAVPLLCHYLYAGAVLGSVAKLDRVAVSFASHLKSLVPGVQFAVLAHPEARLVQVSEEARLPGPGYPTHLTVASQGVEADWVRGRLGQQWNCPDVREVVLPGESVRWWGTPRVAEFAACIADVGVLYQLVSSARRSACRWCGIELVGDRCGFCLSTNRAAGGLPGAENHGAVGHITPSEPAVEQSVAQRQQRSDWSCR